MTIQNWMSKITSNFIYGKRFVFRSPLSLVPIINAFHQFQFSAWEIVKTTSQTPDLIPNTSDPKRPSHPIPEFQTGSVTSFIPWFQSVIHHLAMPEHWEVSVMPILMKGEVTHGCTNWKIVLPVSMAAVCGSNNLAHTRQWLKPWFSKESLQRRDSSHIWFWFNGVVFKIEETRYIVEL